MSEEQEAETADESEEQVDADVEEQADAGAEEAAQDDEGGIQQGDFVRLAYTITTTEGGQVIDTTDEERAEEAGLETEDREFGPRTFVVGEGQLFPVVEDDLTGKDVGDTGSVVIPPEDAFGEYDSDDVRTISTDKIPEDSRYPGAHVDIDGEHGHVEAIYSGRSRVDFNHPLAGEEIEYEYEIEGLVEDRIEKAKGFLNTYFDVDLDMRIETDEVEEETLVEPDEDEEADEAAEPDTETQTVEKETLYIESNPQLQFNQQWMFSKQQIAQQLIEKIDVDRIVIEEIIEGGPAMPGLGGMMGGGDLGDVEEAIEDADVDEDDILEELEAEEAEARDAEVEDPDE